MSDVNYYRNYRNTMQAIISHINEIESNLECVQADPLNCTSAFYFMWAKVGKTI